MEEADETSFWLELLVDAGIVKKSRLEQLRREVDELVRILATSRATAKSR